MNDEWYYLDAEQTVGPYSSASMKLALEEKKLSPETLIWREGLEGWSPISLTREITGITTPPPPPKAAPPSDVDLRRTVRIQGKQLYLAEGYQLPDCQCVSCGLPSIRKYKRRFSYLPPAVWLSVIAPIIFLILFACLHKTRRLSFGLCEKHAQKLLVMNIICWSCAVLFIPVCILSASIDNSTTSTIVGVIGGIILLTCLVFCAIPRPIKFLGLENGFIKIKGVCVSLRQALKG